MVTLVTQGIKISIASRFRDAQSNPERQHFLFSYEVTIENNSSYTVQLLRRHWYIFDSCGEHTEIEGEGVVGEKPLLGPGEVYKYESACNLTTELGRMHGNYLMCREYDQKKFVVHIPEFQMATPFKLN
jgi:ApaG protein